MRDQSDYHRIKSLIPEAAHAIPVCSTSVTWAPTPRFAKKYAVQLPITPPPQMMILFAFVSLLLDISK